MDKMLEAVLAALALLGFIGWLGGGRKWAFRTLLSVVVLVGIGAVGTLLYFYWTDKAVEHRAQKIHECAVAKIADPKCDKPAKDANLPKGSFECPAYILGVDATPEQEESSLLLAEQECRGEMDPKEKSLHEQLLQYKREHGIVVKESSQTGPWTKYQATGDIFDQVTRDCAAEIRKAHPGSYDDLDDEKLTKKFLAKDPFYCIAKPIAKP